VILPPAAFVQAQFGVGDERVVTKHLGLDCRLAPGGIGHCGDVARLPILIIIGHVDIDLVNT
jgi:hypothetical protein